MLGQGLGWGGLELDGEGFPQPCSETHTLPTTTQGESSLGSAPRAKRGREACKREENQGWVDTFGLVIR